MANRIDLNRTTAQHILILLTDLGLHSTDIGFPVSFKAKAK